MKKIAILALVLLMLITAACGNTGSVNTSSLPESAPSPEPIPVPGCVITALKNGDYGHVSCTLSRDDNGLTTYVPPYMMRELLAVVEDMGLETAPEGEKADYTLRYPFTLDFSCPDGQHHIYAFSEGAITVDGVSATAADNKEALSVIYDDDYPYAWISYELYQVKDILPFAVEDIANIEYTDLNDEETNRQNTLVTKTVEYTRAEAAALYEEKLALMVLRKFTAGEMMNPPTGVSPHYKLTAADGRTVSISWCVSIDGEALYENLGSL